MIYSKTNWAKPDDLKANHNSFVEAFAEFLDSTHCPSAVRTIVNEAREKKKRKGTAHIDLDNQMNASNDNYTDEDDDDYDDGELIIDGHDDLDMGVHMMQQQAKENDLDNVNLDNLPPLNDGGIGFNWHQYGIHSMGMEPSINIKDWVQNTSHEIEISKPNQNDDSLFLPSINLLMANPLQRVVIAINLLRLLRIKNGTLPPEESPLRVIIQGTAGVGKTYVVKAITYITRRIFNSNKAVMNLAPTGAASVLLPKGRTVHSTTAIPRSNKIEKHGQFKRLSSV